MDRMSRTKARSFGAAVRVWMTKRMNSTGSGDLLRQARQMRQSSYMPISSDVSAVGAAQRILGDQALRNIGGID